MHKRKLFLILAAIIAISLIGLSAQCGMGITGEAPTIELEIYDGPDYSVSDDMCYYRAEAIVNGDPDPEIEFGTDANISPLGSNRVKVGVKVGESYTLTATANNTQGTASISITLEGECEDVEAGDIEIDEEDTGDEEAEEEPEDEAGEEEAAIDVVRASTGA